MATNRLFSFSDLDSIPKLNGISVLIVEDEFLIAEHLAESLQELGATIIGPVPSVSQALQLVATNSKIDVAVLDVNLRGELGFAVADALEMRRIPFVFATGYSELIPASRYIGAPLLLKPVRPDHIARAIAPLASENRLLAALPSKDGERLRHVCTEVKMERGALLQTAGAPITYLHFPLCGLLAVETGHADTIDIALIGSEGVDGITAALGNAISPFNVVCRVAGNAKRIKTDDFLAEINNSPEINSIFLSYAHDMMQQIAMTALSGACCSLEQRLARWLLLASDRIRADEVTVTHEQLALSLSLRRSGITVATQVLRLAGAITTGRGTFKIANRQQLIDLAGPGYSDRLSS